MKFFVPDARIAAITHAADATAWEAYHRTLAAVGARYQDEIQRLRADRDAELARLVDPQGPFVAHLIAEVAHWRLLYTAERQRADISVDQRLAERGLGPVTLPSRPLGPESPREDLMAELMRQAGPDFAAMGDPAGVER